MGKTIRAGENMTKEKYISFLSSTMTPEMRPLLHDLVIPCNCGSIMGSNRYRWQCAGWRLSTMLRSEIPKHAHARHLAKR